MRRPLALLTAVAVSLLVPVAGAASASAAPASRSSSQPVYLALGDSVAAGAVALPGQGYVPLLAEELRQSAVCLPDQASRRARGCQQLQLVDLSRGSATTTTLISQQLPAALELLEQRNNDRNPRNDVEVITITIGGNDVINAAAAACEQGPTPTCLGTVNGVLAGYEQSLTGILGALRDAAGPDTTIVTTAYYNGLVAGCPAAPTVPIAELVALGELVLEGGQVGPFEVEGLNEIIRRVSAQFGADVADAHGELTAQDLAGDCVHPNTEGHAVLADIFEDVILG